MRRRADLSGFPVVEIDSGRTLGRITDIVFDFDQGRLQGFVVEGAGDRGYLAFDQVESIGSSAVTARAGAGLEPAPSSAPRTAAPGTDAAGTDAPAAGRGPVGLRVITRDGRVLGFIDDIIFDPDSGVVWGYQVTGGLLSDLVDGKKAVPLTDELVVGPDSVVIPDGGLRGSGENEGAVQG